MHNAVESLRFRNNAMKSPKVQEYELSTKSDTTTQQSETPKNSQLAGHRLTIESSGRICPKVTVTSSEGQNYCLGFHRIKKPDIRIYRDQVDGPLAAVAYIHSWSRVYQIGVGTDEISMEWVKSKTKVYPKRPTFEWRGETYTLARVSEDENGEKLQKPKWRCYFAVKDSAGRYVAFSLPDGREKRILKFAEGVSEGLGLVILLAICSWQEEMRRAG